MKPVVLTQDMNDILDCLVKDRIASEIKIDNYIQQCAYMLKVNLKDYNFHAQSRDFKKKKVEGEENQSN